MKVGIIISSHRKESQSAKVGGWLNGVLKDMSVQTWVYDLGKNPLPIWDDSFWDGGEYWDKIWKPIEQELLTCDSFVIVSPEYSGMASPALKNFFLYLGPVHVGHKPALIVGVSSTRGGAYPVAELRESSYKNTRICYIPEHIIVRDADHMMNAGEPSSKDDEYIRSRSIFALKVLIAYSEALSEVRETGVTNDPRFKNGM
ncbi:NADPH-dependent oxidoreductase [Leptospira perolatii]|uniref:NADPH-dependent oxidoreductase n=1 Tax=Leptospira perolatii TaxID=2023191 RepID=A0A2M9ZPF4_9LEPT|nr:NAD(P)H-dependent oxidoreductase [Leptospira perolatii]PJZ70739.1 NADPH-dependent oxidoreductase [Leptospira perolatii]PJZ73947.1 NADPH-dependent oxidoreductase [Leptospira perolatii]